MAKTYNKMLIDVNEEIDGIITEVQADQNSRYLDIYLYNNGVPIDLTDHTVRIYMRRPKTNPLEEFFDDGEITEEVNGRCQFLLKTQALAKEGFLEAQITIWKGAEELLSTHMFKIKVVTNIMSDGSVEASNEYGALVVLFQNVYDALAAMETMVGNFGLPGKTAKEVPAETFWQMLEAVYSVNAEALKNASVSAVLEMLNEEISKEKTSNEILRVLNAGVNANFRSPIAVTINNGATLNTNYEMLSGTGRGKLFVYTANEGLVKITIDGNIIVSKSALISGQVVEMEFAESFSVWNVADASGSNYITRALAVFY